MIQINGSPIIEKDHLSGVSFWAKWDMHSVPRFKLYKYIGHCEKNLLHYFRAHKGPEIVSMRMEQLAVSGFKAFVLDYKRIKEELQNLNDNP